MPKCILSGQVKSTFTQEQADGRYIQMTNGATTTLASSLQVSGINNIEFTEEGEKSITASNVSYSNTTSGMTSGNVQNAIDELFQSVSESKSLIAAAVTDKGVETAATDSFATMAGNIGQISSGGGQTSYPITNGGGWEVPPPNNAMAGEFIEAQHMGGPISTGVVIQTKSGKKVPYFDQSHIVTFVMPGEDITAGFYF